jgi:predicted HNH restriction endonuclease
LEQNLITLCANCHEQVHRRGPRRELPGH